MSFLVEIDESAYPATALDAFAASQTFEIADARENLPIAKAEPEGCQHKGPHRTDSS